MSLQTKKSDSGKRTNSRLGVCEGRLCECRAWGDTLWSCNASSRGSGQGQRRQIAQRDLLCVFAHTRTACSSYCLGPSTIQAVQQRYSHTRRLHTFASQSCVWDSQQWLMGSVRGIECMIALGWVLVHVLLLLCTATHYFRVCDGGCTVPGGCYYEYCYRSPSGWHCGTGAIVTTGVQGKGWGIFYYIETPIHFRCAPCSRHNMCNMWGVPPLESIT